MAGTSIFCALGSHDLFGRLALQRGLVSRQQLQDAITEQLRATKAGIKRRLGEILVKKGYISERAVGEILASQGQLERKRIGDFIIISKLGQGAMGVVHKALQTSMGREIALKTLSRDLAQDHEFRERFLSEARAVARLNHPHIVSGIDVGCVEGTYYFAMEYIEGEDLGRRVSRRGKVSESEALRIIRQTASALQHAHRYGIFHRDVKPENIMIDMDGSPKLADLGLVQFSRSRGLQAIGKLGYDPDEVGMAIGTPHYMPPEQAQGMEEITPAADLYSLGASLYCLLTGRPPFKGRSASEVMVKQVKETPRSPQYFNADISDETAALCLRLLEKEPRDRIQSGQELVMAIERIERGAPIEVASERRPKSARLGTTGRQRKVRGIHTVRVNPVVRAGHRRRVKHSSNDGTAGILLLGLAILIAVIALIASL